jgi:phasin family protein
VDFIMANTTTSTTTNGLLDVTKIMGGFRLPGIDMEAAVASQRKSLEALAQANQLAVEGVQAVMRRQVEITRQAMEDFSAMFRDLVQPNGSPEDKLAKQAEYSKHAVEKSLSSVKELTDLAVKANTEVFSVLNKRATESFDEVRDFAKKSVAAR